MTVAAHLERVAREKEPTVSEQKCSVCGKPVTSENWCAEPSALNTQEHGAIVAPEARKLAEQIRDLYRSYAAGEGQYVHIEDEIEMLLAAALAACAREEAKWWHTRVAMAALCDDQEVRGECRERMDALERAVGESK